MAIVSIINQRASITASSSAEAAALGLQSANISREACIVSLRVDSAGTPEYIRFFAAGIAELAISNVASDGVIAITSVNGVTPTSLQDLYDKIAAALGAACSVVAV